MLSLSENELSDLQQELERVAEAWWAVRAAYDSSEIEPRLSPVAWAELGTARPSMDSPDGITPSLVEAWRTVVLEARAVFLDELVPWAIRVVSAFGVDRFPTDAPEPPHVERQTGYYELGESVRLLTGTSDTREAGLRLILWAAAQRDPRICRRSDDYPTLIWIWISNLVEFSGGICRPVSAFMDWVRFGFEHLAGNDESKQSRFRLERLPGKKIEVEIHFDGEKCVLRGTQAERLSLLIRQGQVNWRDLAGTPRSVEGSHSVVPASKIEVRGDGEQFQAAGRDALTDEDLRDAQEQLARIRREIEQAQTDMEREQLEQEQEKLNNKVRRLLGARSKPIQLAKERIDKDLRRLRDKLLTSMPKFVAHLEQSAIRFDSVKNNYIYTPGDGITWEFKGF